MSQNNGSQAIPARSATRNLGQLLHRLIGLLELQAELLKVDAQSGLRSLGVPVALLLGGIVSLFGGCLLLLASIAAALSELAGWPVYASLLAAAVTGLVVAAGAGFLGWNLARKGLGVFERSRSELGKNVRWLRDAVRSADD